MSEDEKKQDLGIGCSVAVGHEWAAIVCRTPGMSGITEPHAQQQPDGSYEARIGVMLFGCLMDEGSLDGDPFSPEFRDNYATGKGATQQDALVALKADLASMYEGLWA